MKLFGGTLLDKGVREVSIIGDSHLRAFMCSIEYMAGGDFAYGKGRVGEEERGIGWRVRSSF